jgi:hypothetical protein
VRDNDVALIAGIFPKSAAAQGAGVRPAASTNSPIQVEGSAGYSVVWYKGSGSRADANPIGWFGSFAMSPVRRFAIVAEFSVEYATEILETGRQNQRRAYTFIDGPRWIVLPATHASIFAEALVGDENDDFVSRTSTGYHFIVQPAIGVDVNLATHVTARFHGSSRFDPDHLGLAFVQRIGHLQPAPAGAVKGSWRPPREPRTGPL